MFILLLHGEEAEFQSFCLNFHMMMTQEQIIVKMGRTSGIEKIGRPTIYDSLLHR